MEITEEEVWTALKRMQKERAPGIDEVYTEMIIAVEEVGVSWTKKLSNICKKGFNSGEVEDRVNRADMEGERVMFKIWGSAGVLTPKPCNECAGEDSGWEDKEECERRDRRRATGFWKGIGMTDGMFALRKPVEKRLKM